MGTWLWSPIEVLGSNRGGSIIKAKEGWHKDVRVLLSYQPTEMSYFTVLLLLPQGIQYLIEHEVLSPDLQEIAKFLHKGEGLNKTAIGDYLGGRWATQPGWGGPLESCLTTFNLYFRWPLADLSQVPRLNITQTAVGWVGRTLRHGWGFGVWLRLAVWDTCPPACNGVSLPR